MIRQPPVYVPSAIAGAAREHDPVRHVEVGRRQVAVGDQGERDDAHRLLRVVGAVRQRDHRRRRDLRPAEAALRPLGGEVPDHAVDDHGRAERDDAGQHRGDQRGHDDLREHALALDRREPDRRHGRADHAADQRVRGRRRDAEPPGDQVPGDRTDQAGEDRRGGDDARIDDPLGHGGGHGDRDEGAGEIENCGDADSHLRLQRACRDGGRHRVGGVVEAVREVEHECDGHDEHDDDLPSHDSRPYGRDPLSGWSRSQLGNMPSHGPRVLSGPWQTTRSRRSRARLEARLAELAPAVDEATRIKAALAALNGGPRPPVTALDALKPVPPPDGARPSGCSEVPW